MSVKSRFFYVFPYVIFIYKVYFIIYNLHNNGNKAVLLTSIQRILPANICTKEGRPKIGIIQDNGSLKKIIFLITRKFVMVKLLALLIFCPEIYVYKLVYSFKKHIWGNEEFFSCLFFVSECSRFKKLLLFPFYAFIFSASL